MPSQPDPHLNKDADTAWETVHQVSSYYDTPLEGLADFQGNPVVFFVHEEIVRPSLDCPDDFEAYIMYALHPASQDLASDLREQYAMFERWHQAHSQDKSNMQYHPALPADRVRYEELKSKTTPLLSQLRSSKPDAIRKGRFAADRRQVEEGCSRYGSFEVQWLSS